MKAVDVMLAKGNCNSLIIITSPSDTGYRGRCKAPFANPACLITDDEKKKCEEGYFCCYFSDLYLNYNYFCHKDIWRRFIRPYEDNLELILFCYLSEKKELVASGFFSGVTSGPAHRDIPAGRFVKDFEGDYRYIAGDKERSLRFPYDIILPKLNSISPSGFIRTVSNGEMIQVLEKACSVVERLGSSMDTDAVVRIAEVIRDLSRSPAEAGYVQPDADAEAKLAPWLQALFDETEEIQVTDLKTQVSELQEKAAATEDPRYFLVASKLQFGQGDYKYILSLANFCYFRGHKLKKKRDFTGAREAFAEAVKLYKLDPVEKGWKKDYIEKCLNEFLKLTAAEVADDRAPDATLEKFFGEMIESVGVLEPYVRLKELGCSIEQQYYALRLEGYWDVSDTDGYISFFEANILGRPIENELRPVLVARYYQLLAKVREQRGSASDLLEAAEFRRTAAERQRDRANDQYTVSAYEDLIEMNKDLALAAHKQGDVTSFLEFMDKAIEIATKVYETEPTARRRENLYFLEGLKYRNLAKKPDADRGVRPAETKDVESRRTANESTLTDGLDQKVFLAISGDCSSGAFEEALALARCLQAEAGTGARNVPTDLKRVYAMIIWALSACLGEAMSEDEIWAFVEDVSFCRRVYPGTLAVKVGETVARWCLGRSINGFSRELPELRTEVAAVVETFARGRPGAEEGGAP